VNKDQEYTIPSIRLWHHWDNMGIFRQHCREIGRRDIRTTLHVGIVLDHPENYEENNYIKCSLGQLAPQIENLGPNIQRGKLGVHLAFLYIWYGGHNFAWGAMRAKKRCVRAAKTGLNWGRALGGAFEARTDEGATL